MHQFTIEQDIDAGTQCDLEVKSQGISFNYNSTAAFKRV